MIVDDAFTDGEKISEVLTRLASVTGPPKRRQSIGELAVLQVLLSTRESQLRAGKIRCWLPFERSILSQDCHLDCCLALKQGSVDRGHSLQCTHRISQLVLLQQTLHQKLSLLSECRKK